MKKALITMTIALTPYVSGMAQEAYRPSSALDAERHVIVIHADGTHQRHLTMTTEILSAAGIDERGEQVMSYNSSMEALEITSAFTLTRDGITHPVAKDKIRTLDDELSGGAAEYSDTKHKVIIFPQVDVGAKLTFTAQSHQHAPHFVDKFFLITPFSPHEIYRHSEYILYVHPSVELQISAKGMQGGRVDSTYGPAPDYPPNAQGYTVYKYSLRQTQVISPEPGQVRDIQHISHLIVSNFTDYLDVGQSFQKYAAPKIRVSEKVRVLADKITAGKNEPIDQIKAIYHWVVRNIRYVAVYLGDGGFEPHDVDEILQAGYGDCKDHVVVLESLLAAIGIQSSPALINGGMSYSLAPVASPYPFNHVISYLPQFDLFLDPTAQFSAFGVLPDSELDKPVVLTALHRIAHTPKMKAEEHRTESRIDLEMLADGTLRGTSKTIFKGTAEADARGMHFDREGHAPARAVRQLLSRFNETGSGVIRDTDPSKIDQPFELTAQFELDAPANVPGPSAFTLPIGLSPGRIAAKAYSKPHANRQFPVVCASETIREHYRIRFPKSIRVTRVPSGLDYHQDGIDYSSRYALSATDEGQVLEVVRELAVQREHNYCAPKEQIPWEKFHTLLQRDVRSQVFFE